ncbi:hypothetical protein [Mesorhizobium sp. CN2-181]|uniref:hypothetical protein n=1 Tax=Mesorhizobium yinganensis TaxID=3157707 RepID=UPI0032B85231
MTGTMRKIAMIILAGATLSAAGCQMDRQTTGSIWPTNCAATGSTCETPDRNVPNK